MACGLCYFALALGFLTGGKFDLRRGVNSLTYKLKQTSIFNRYIPKTHICVFVKLKDSLRQRIEDLFLFLRSP